MVTSHQHHRQLLGKESGENFLRGRGVNTHVEPSPYPGLTEVTAKGFSKSPCNFQNDLQLHLGSRKIEGATPPREEEHRWAAGGSRRNPDSPNCRIVHSWGLAKGSQWR